MEHIADTVLKIKHHLMMSSAETPSKYLMSYASDNLLLKRYVPELPNGLWMKAIAEKIGPKYVQVSGEKLKPEVREKLKYWLANRAPQGPLPCGLFLYGLPGTGKTSILALLMKILVKRHSFLVNAIEYYTIHEIVDILRLLKSFIPTLRERAEYELQCMLSLRIIFVDDLELDWDSEDLRLIAEFIDKLYRKERTLFIVTNAGDKAIVAAIKNNIHWARIFRRLMEMCYRVAVE